MPRLPSPEEAKLELLDGLIGERSAEEGIQSEQDATADLSEFRRANRDRDAHERNQDALIAALRGMVAERHQFNTALAVRTIRNQPTPRRVRRSQASSVA